MRVEASRLAGGLDPARALQIAAALERGSPHPLARLFQPHDAGLTVEHAQQHALGVSGRIEGCDYRLGRADFVANNAAPVDGEVWLAQVDGPARAVFVWDEQLKPDALQLLAMIRQLGITPHLLSGDTPARAQRMAAQLQIEHCIAAATPDEKLAQLASLREGPAPARCIAMIGDGHNDAPSLAGADVSMALADGADAARQAADIVLCSPRLTRIGEAVLLSRQLRRVCQQSLLWALLYNLGMLPLAVSGLLSPGWAALGMSLSSLLVTLNALRLRRPVQVAQKPQSAVGASLAVSGELR
jgi:Cu2+-exporting ATPase